VTFNKSEKPELIALLPTKGWNLEAGHTNAVSDHHTLEDLVRRAHERYQKGEALSLIKQVENEVEVDAVELQKLWAHLGLPI